SDSSAHGEWLEVPADPESDASRLAAGWAHVVAIAFRHRNSSNQCACRNAIRGSDGGGQRRVDQSRGSRDGTGAGRLYARTIDGDPSFAITAGGGPSIDRDERDAESRDPDDSLHYDSGHDRL